MLVVLVIVIMIKLIKLVFLVVPAIPAIGIELPVALVIQLAAVMRIVYQLKYYQQCEQCVLLVFITPRILVVTLVLFLIPKHDSHQWSSNQHKQ